MKVRIGWNNKYSMWYYYNNHFDHIELILGKLYIMITKGDKSK